MPYKDGSWGEKEKARSKRRASYFRARNEIKSKSSTSLGYTGELLALNIFSGSTHARKSTHDIEWNGNKIEVKSAKPTLARNKVRWKFYLRAKNKQSDAILFLCYHYDGKLLNAYLIPTAEITTKHFSVPSKNKDLNKYLMKGVDKYGTEGKARM